LKNRSRSGSPLSKASRSSPGRIDSADVPLAEQISRLEKEMKAAAKRLEFEEAAALRDKLRELREVQIYAG
jgi:excinuclease ABC subunit B